MNRPRPGEPRPMHETVPTGRTAMRTQKEMDAALRIRLERQSFRYGIIIGNGQ